SHHIVGVFVCIPMCTIISQYLFSNSSAFNLQLDHKSHYLAMLRNMMMPFSRINIKQYEIALLFHDDFFKKATKGRKFV
ncbi:MAG: hypothetical protein AB7Y74_14195, partial [Syntrophorhabdus sp.]